MKNKNIYKLYYISAPKSVNNKYVFCYYLINEFESLKYQEVEFNNPKDAYIFYNNALKELKKIKNYNNKIKIKE